MQSKHDNARRRLIPYLVLFLSLFSTVAATVYMARTTNSKDWSRFDSAVGTTEDAVRQRTETYINVLRAGRALFAANESLSREEFARWVESLEVQKQYPGVQGIGFSIMLPREKVDELEARMREQGVQQFAVWPESAAPRFSSIIYLEPPDRRNRTAIGYDMHTERVRAAAMDRARNTGVPAASARVFLVQEIDPKKSPGFLIYVPVYQGGRVPPTVDDRQRMLLGFVYAPFRAMDLLDAVLSKDLPVAVALFDGATANPAKLLHADGDFGTRRARFRRTRTLDIAGEPWTLEVESRPEFEASSSRNQVYVIFAAGIIFSFVLFRLSHAQGIAAAQLEGALDDLRERESELREEKGTLEELNRVGRVVAGELDVGKVVQAVTDAATGLTRARFGAFFYHRTDPDGDRFALYSLTGADRAAFEAMPLPRKTGLLAPLFDGVRSVRIDDVRSDPAFHENDPYGGLPSGHLPVVSFLGTPVVSRHGEVLGALIFGHPEPGVFTERAEQVASTLAAQAAVAIDNARLFESAEHDRRRAEEANLAKDEFLANVSHELRTPMTAILGWAALLETDALDAETRQTALHSIRRGGKTQAQLIDDLLDISRIGAGKIVINREPVDLSKLVPAAVDSFRPVASERTVRLDVAVPSTPLTVEGDPRRLQQVLMNLLSNAVKFSDPATCVSVTARREISKVVLVVEDEGQGIAPDFLPHVFDRFRQADGTPTRAHGGLGIGLSISKYLVESHGGEIHAESEGTGKGARFTVVLPLVDAAVETHSERPELKPEPLHGVKIVFAEDEADIRAYVAAVLRGAGASVAECGGGADAYDVIWRDGTNVLISDLAMPGGDGYTLMRRLRASDRALVREIASIALSAFTRPEDENRAREAGFDMFLGKPVDPELLVRTVMELLSRR